MGGGFIPGSRASFIMDSLVIAMGLFLCIIGYSIANVRKKKSVRQHRKIQLLSSTILIAAIILFEVDVRLYGWQEQAKKSPFFDTILYPFLYLHIAIAILAFGAWMVQLITAYKRVDRELKYTSQFAANHKKLGWMATALMTATAVSGWIFYYMAFIALSD
ncbi:MAG: DUF420 domain-containing protein [Bdellovibrionota bacterium]